MIHLNPKEDDVQKLAFLFIFISTTSFAHTLMLTKHVSSGNVRPEDSFLKDCKIYREGYAIIKTKMGTNPTRTHTHNVSHARVLTIRGLLGQARNGRIEVTGVTCDGGNKLLYGYYRGVKFILDEDMDCGEHRVNQSSATPLLVSQAQSICGF